jgi:hypothetical protein
MHQQRLSSLDDNTASIGPPSETPHPEHKEEVCKSRGTQRRLRQTQSRREWEGRAIRKREEKEYLIN